MSEQLNDSAPIDPSDFIKGGHSVQSLEDQERVPNFVRTISELKSLSDVIQTFYCRWDELQKHLDYIESAIESQEKQLANLPSDQLLQDSETLVMAKECEATTSAPMESEASPLSEKNTEMPSLTKESKDLPLTEKETHAPSLTAESNGASSLTAKHASESGLSNLSDQEAERTSQIPLIPCNPGESELQLICSTMCGRELRRYIVKHLCHPSNLREELPKALKCASNPAKLVLESVGKFFRQGIRAFTKGSPLFKLRLAANILLEQFLLSDCFSEMDQSVMKEAEEGPKAWRKRLVAEGGVGMAGTEDARGLLLFVACFGIPDIFTIEDLIHLLRLGGMHSISKALSKSTSLLDRMPQIIDCMRTEGKEIEAIDTIYSFGIQDKIPPQKILAGFLKNLKEACKKARSEGRGSPYLLKEARQKQVTALKSLKNCLAAHKIDPTSVIPYWKISEKVIKLEKDIAEMNRRIDLKRKTEEQSTKISYDQELKRSKNVGAISVPSHSPFSSLQEPRVDNPYEELKGSKIVGATSVPTPSPFSSLQKPRVDNPYEDLKGPKNVGVASVPTHPPFNSLQEPRVDNPPVYHLYNRYADDPVSRYLTDSSWPHDYTIGMSNRVGQHGTSLSSNFSSGSNSVPPVPSFGRYGGNSQSSSDRLMDDRFARSMDLGNRAHPGLSYLTEGVPSASKSPSFAVARQSSPSDLYSFADSVGEGEYTRGSDMRGTTRPPSSSYRSSFL